MNDILPIILKYVNDSQTWNNISLCCKKFSQICKKFVKEDYVKFLHLKKILVCITGVDHSYGRNCVLLNHRMGEECSCKAFPRHWENKFSYTHRIDQDELQNDEYNVFVKLTFYDLITTIKGNEHSTYPFDFSWDQVIWPGDKKQLIAYNLPDGITQ